MAITAYDVVEAENKYDFDRLADAKITAGFQPYGRLIFNEGRYVQAFIQGNPVVDQATVTAFQPGDPTISTPTTGQTVTVTPAGFLTAASIEPAGTLAELTLTLEDGTISGQEALVKFSQIITTLTVTATNMDATPHALPTSAAVGDVLRFVWNNTAGKWTLM